MQESRLFRILYYLLDKGRATAPELAEKFEVSVRTVYRDIDALSGAGIPVYTEAGRNGGIYLMNHFVLDKVILEDQEKREILSAMQNASVVGIEGKKTTLEKLSALFGMSPEKWYEVDFSRWGSQTGDNEKFELLRNAITVHRRVRILYAGAGRKKERRTVEPLKLLYKSKAWYLKAWCMKREALRLFKLNRILECGLLGESFTPKVFPEQEVISENAPEGVLLSDGLPEEEPPQVILSFSAHMAYRVYDEFDRSQIEELPDGRLLVTAPMPEDEWLIAFLLSFGSQVEVIRPAYLRPVLAERALEIYRMNTSDGQSIPERNQN